MTPEQTILFFGFRRAGSCSCGGSHNDIYRKDGYALYYRKRKHVFKVKERNSVIIPITSLNNLETVLKQLFPDVVVQKEVQAVPG